MKVYLLYSVLGEFARQFKDSADAISKKMEDQGLVTSQRIRVWKNEEAATYFGESPTEDDDPTLWEWAILMERPSSLNDLYETLYRFASFVEGLEPRKA